MRTQALLASVVVAVGVGGCVQRVPELPKDAFVVLGSKQAPYRDWSSVKDLCAIDEKRFTGEQQAMTELLADWLGQTSANADGAWDDEHLALLEAGTRQLPRALELQQAALERAGKAACPFPGFGSAKELNGQAQRRVADAPWLLEQVRARQALARWKEQRPAAEAAAKEANCITKAKPPAPILYFAAEDETARLEWLFCDGAKVVASPGNPPAWEPSPTAKPSKKAPDPKLWLDVAAKYPPESVSRAPKLPKKKVAPKDAGEEPI